MQPEDGGTIHLKHFFETSKVVPEHKMWGWVCISALGMCYTASLWQMWFPPQTIKISTDFYPERSSFTALLCDKDNPHNKLSHSPSLEKSHQLSLSHWLGFSSITPLRWFFEGKYLSRTFGGWERKMEKTRGEKKAQSGVFLSQLPSSSPDSCS